MTKDKHEPVVMEIQRQKSRYQVSRRRTMQLLTQFCLCVLCSCLLAAILFVASLTGIAQQASNKHEPLHGALELSVSEALTSISILQGLLSAAITITLTRAFMMIQWGLVARPSGVLYLDQLLLSPSTFDLGAIRLVLGDGTTMFARIWGSFR